MLGPRPRYQRPQLERYGAAATYDWWMRSPRDIPDSELTWRFVTSGGPGGQHANTSHTAVELSCPIDVVIAQLDAGPFHADLLRAKFGGHVTTRAAASRSQMMNRQQARTQFDAKVERALMTDPARRPTRPSRGARETRLSDKRHASQTKALRQLRPTLDD